MPVRPRRARRARNALTLRRYMDLTVGPTGVEPVDVLCAVFTEHRRRFDDSSWGARYFEQGLDDREGDDELYEVGAVALPGA